MSKLQVSNLLSTSKTNSKGIDVVGRKFDEFLEQIAYTSGNPFPFMVVRLSESRESSITDAFSKDDHIPVTFWIQSIIKVVTDGNHNTQCSRVANLINDYASDREVDLGIQKTWPLNEILTYFCAEMKRVHSNSNGSIGIHRDLFVFLKNTQEHLNNLDKGQRKQHFIRLSMILNLFCKFISAIDKHSKLTR